ncbi:YdaU family protein [Burkholderia multivorans]|uniref:YdaU family protein n=1 Tax=Burkholderia multivorans TaxID=87883 RepID=UPI000AD368B0|nr:YdaU family protein [Burkholderia multivorans]MBU9203098.1 YdaU family protein [Burkholderia multivorans]MCA8385337.1 YdaU family protein [Burkholderia multivorans]
MHQYPHHIGDFRSGTHNMSRLERWIYRDLIEVYYDKEGPLTLNLVDLCRDIGARTDEERAIVEDLLNYKFIKTDAGYVHDVCERVLAEYRSKADTARENGKKGGRPRKADGNQGKPSGFPTEPAGAPEETGSKTNHKPITNNHKPEKQKTERVPRFDAQARLVSLGVDPKVAEDFLTLRKKKRLEPTETAIDGLLAEARKTQLTFDAVLRICCTRGWGGFEAAWITNRQQGSASGQMNRQEALEAKNNQVAQRWANGGRQ